MSDVPAQNAMPPTPHDVGSLVAVPAIVSDDRISLLLVDDDSEDAFLTRELLSDVPSLRCSVKVVDNAEAAVCELLTRAYDVCLLDYRLGAQTGLDVLTSAAMMGCDVPCILLTGQDDEETDRAALAAGAVDFLVKGRFDGDTLARTIRYALRNAQTVRSLRTSEQRFRSVVEAATDAIIVVADDGSLKSWNPRAVKLFGHTPQALGALSFWELFLTDIESETLAALVTELRGKNQLQSDDPFELAAKTASGGSFPCELTMADWSAEDGHNWTVIIRDVTDRKAMQERLTHQAFHDPLTDLANRSLFRNRVEHGINRLTRRQGFLGVLFCDLDDFKRINDTLGHAAGDDLLVAVAQRLLGCIRSHDTAARLGGDEFAILVEDAIDPRVAIQVAERVLTAMNRPFVVAGREVVVTASVGIAVTVNSEVPAEELLRNADVAMYSAKSSGKGRFVVFEGEMHQALMDRLQLESDLRRAIDHEQIVVYYQPIVRLPDLTLRGFEALARWNHPTRGVVSPAEFIPLAEELGMIPAIGRQVLRRACRELRTWHDMTGRHDLVVSVNISIRQLDDELLRDIVDYELQSSGLKPSSLVLEITESAMAHDPKQTAERLARVADLGVKIAIDDFGTGYSSLSYLRDLPVDILKVDRSFVVHLAEEEGRGGALVRAIVAMAHSLGLEAVAEGVETGEQQDALSATGCDFAQGYLFARPLTAADTVEFLRSFAVAATTKH